MKEVIFIGIPGSTHNYGGLAFGNVASANNANTSSSPKMAALQALDLAEILLNLGIETAILPPHPRVFNNTPRPLEEFIESLDLKELSQLSSSAFMWAANAATVTTSNDSEDSKLHITPANLVSNKHRAVESDQTYKILSQIFAGNEFVVHKPISTEFGDEGAANHMRLAVKHDAEGLNIFVYGASENSDIKPQKYPARQSLEAFKVISKNHKVTNSLFIQQNPEVIDKGAFHNDVIAVANENILLMHEKAFLENPEIPFDIIEVKEAELSVEEAVKTYFFNSQIVTKPNGDMVIIAPIEVKNSDSVKAVMDNIIQDSNNPISELVYLDLTQSMKNGGGPACLRLRVPMNDSQIAQVKSNANVVLNIELLGKLKAWVEKNYRDELHPGDLKNPELHYENREGLKELSDILRLDII